MIRNLVLRLPGLKCTSDYAVSPSFRQRSFRSLSPVEKVHNALSTERSVSSSRVETGHIIDITRTPRPQTLCLSKEYYGQKHDNKNIKEKQWREKPMKKELDQNKEQFDSYEQYELEAAKPRPIRSRDVIEAFSKPKDGDNDGFFHLQPSQIKPYGSQNNIYSPTLIMPVHLIKHPKKLKKLTKKDPLESERKSSSDLENMGYRNYSTSSDIRKVSTSRSYVAKECHNSRNIIDEIPTNQNTSSMVKKNIDNIKLSSNPKESNSSSKKTSSKGCVVSSENHNPNDNTDDISGEQSPNKQKDIENLKYMLNPKEITALKNMQQTYKEPLETFKRRLQFRPPEFLPRKLGEEETNIKFSTKKERRERREKENKNRHLYYKSSYSDLVKLKLKEVEEGKNEILNQVPFNLKASTNKACLGCFINHSPNTNQMLKITKKIPKARSLMTRSKSNLMLKESSSPMLDSTPKNNVFGSSSLKEIQDQRSYSKKSKSSKSKKGRATKKAQSQERENKPDCEHICPTTLKAKTKSAKKQIPLEPQACELIKKHKKIYLPSRVKLPVAPCVERPPYRDCKKEEKCPPRADECLVETPKKLPKLQPGCCPCVEIPLPTQAPKLEKLHFKFEDPPRPVCHPPPCQTPRADDLNPYKFAPLKPYVPGECECIEPPPMIDVKLKRLPKCEPEEICRPKRVCPVIEKCPERADKCLTIERKQLPPLDTACCPCIEPPLPKEAPSIKRLNLDVPEPQRECKKPPVCTCTGRADDCLEIKRKKLPKFVPGDCPCEDRPMTDWNLKRLVCKDEVTECIVPDPCKAFPRADWGCWEYEDQVCEEVNEKCIEKIEKCPSPKPLKGHPCDKPDICKSLRERELSYMPKRKYSKASLKLYHKVKNQNSSKDEGHVKITSNVYKPPEIKQSKTKSTKSAKINNNIINTNKKLKSKSTLSLIKLLNNFEHTKEKEDPILFKPKEKEQLNYETILKKIASSTVVTPKQVTPKVGILTPNLKRTKSNTIRVASRAISTTKIVSKNEKDIQKEKESDGKNKCKNIRPSIKALCRTRKMCRLTPICTKPPETRVGCKTTRVPVCCEKEESPYTAFSENLEESIRPYTKTPQFICNRVEYGYYPTYKKQFDPLDNSKKQETKEKKAHCTLKKCQDKSKKKDQKSYSTCTLINGVPQTPPSFTEHSRISCRPIATLGTHLLNSKASTSIPKVPSKALLKTPINQRVRTTHSRTFTSKIFQIQPPVVNKKPKTGKGCKEENVKTTADEIGCPPTSQSTFRWGCKRERLENNCKRKPPPFPAFSDCLDEEMETILTECPLDKEKYNRIQPRFMNVLKKPLTLKPPPPVQGKLDLLKEQECIREKLCLEKGLTQDCSDFGKPIPLKKAKKIFSDKKYDCERMEELKKVGRWPPFTLKQNRRLCTSTLSTLVESRQYLSTLGLNSIYEISKDSPTTTRVPVKRVDIRDYHALVKNPDKCVLNHQEIEPTKKIFPDMDETIKLLKLRKKQWRITNLKNYELNNRQNEIAKRVKRFYTTYRTKKRNFLTRKSKGLTIKTHMFRRKVSNNAKLFYKSNNMRGKRTLKNGKSLNSTRRERCQYKICKRQHSKFTLNCGSSKYYRKAVGKQGRKSVVPSFSKNKNFITLKKRSRKFQQGYNVSDDSNSICGQYPEQEKINHRLSYEYFRCKNGLQNKGITFDCQSLGMCPKTPDLREDYNDKSFYRAKISCDKQRDLAEFHVQEHQKHEETANSIKKDEQKKEDCERERDKLENICIQHCMKSFPCHLPEEEKYAICKAECKKIYSPYKPKPERFEEKEEVPATPESGCCLQKKSCPPPPPHCPPKPAKSEMNCQTEPSTSKAVICTVPSTPCPPKKSKSITQLENLWQRIVNYFKARPNCPEPGEWKKRALREKAEKAAKAAGLIILDPKCLPPNILRTAQASKKDCKVCPKDYNDQKESDCDANKSAPTGFSKRNFSTSVQPTRNYSRSATYDNLDEINRLLEEEQLKERLEYKGSNHKSRRGLAIFPERKDTETSEALKLSLDVELYKDVDFGSLCFKNKRPSRTYFGYSDIIPSRENILERAWRISIESNNVYNCPKVYNFFNEFFRKMEKNIQSIEDLEKLKTENVLRELEEFLKDEEPDKTKK